MRHARARQKRARRGACEIAPFCAFHPSLTARGRLLPLLLLLRDPHMNLAGLTLLLVALATSCGAIDNGLGRTPP